MNLRHIDELTTEPWFRNPWVLLGTGPSLDTFEYEKWKDYNIAAIYDAANVCERATIVFASDWWDGKDWHIPYFDKTNIIATRIINVDQTREKTYFWEYDCDVEQMGGRRLLPQYRTYPCSNTSSFITYWLGTHGVRTIYTSGIDGGWGVSSSVSDWYRDNAMESKGWDPDRENEGIYGHASSFGIQLIRI
jgi:hypothetical protein